MKIEILNTEYAFLALKDGWNALTREPLQSWEWNYWWWKHLGQEFPLRIITAIQGGKVVGIAPFIAENRKYESCLRFIGSGNACTDYAQVLVVPDATESFCDAIARRLLQHGGPLSDISLVEFEGVSQEANGRLLSKKLGRHFWNYQRELESTWVIDLPDNWDEFFSARHKSLRRKIRKAEKRYSSGEAIARSTRDELDFDSAFDILVDLHQQRFASIGKPGVFADDRFTNFLRCATKSLASQHRAEIVVGYLAGEPIVAHLYLHNSLGPQMYQSGMAVEQIRSEPGHLLLTHTVRKAIENGCRKFDFLRGDEQYKHFWGATRMPLYTIRCVSNRLPSTIKHQVIRGIRQMKSWVSDSHPVARRKTAATS